MTDQLQIAGQAPIQLTASRYIFGREDGCDVVLQTSNGTVSRQHAALERDTRNQWNIVDLNSTNGVYVNEQRVTASRALSNGDNIRIGDCHLTLVAIPEVIPQKVSVQEPPPIKNYPPVHQPPPVVGPYPPGGSGWNNENPGRPLGIASVILGACTFGIQMIGGICCGWVGWPLGIAAIICGIIAIVQGEVTLGAIGCGLSVVGVFIQLMGLGILGASIGSSMAMH